MLNNNHTQSSVQYIKIAYGVNKLKTLAMIFLSVMLDLIPLLKTITMANALDKIIWYLKEPNLDHAIVLATVLFFATYLLEYFIEAGFVLFNQKFQIDICAAMEDGFLHKINAIKYENFEDLTQNDLIDRVREGIGSRFSNGFSTLLNFSGIFIRILGIIAIVAVKNIYVGALTFLMLLVVIPIAKKTGEDDYSAYEESRKAFRVAKAFREPLTERRFAEERTLFGFTHFLNPIWKSHYSKAIAIENQALKKNYIKTAISSMSTAIISSLIALSMTFAVKNGSMSTGVYISVVTSVFSLVHMMSWNFADLVETMVSNEKYLLDYKRFMALSETENEVNKNVLDEEIHRIRFENVSFTYPNAQIPALSQFSYEFKKGKTYALVGANGAGKSTIVKLMTGLYSDYTGEIYLNDTNLRTLKKESIYNGFSIVYQDYMKYQMSLRHNLNVGNKKLSLDEKINGSFEEDQKILSILEKLSLADKVKHLEQGLSTPLGKLQENGVDFSGGESQKLAITRSLMHDTDIYVLDEPTAALDPLSEMKLYELYNQVFADKTAILITHRLGNTKNQEVILVLDDGKLKEVGNHRELMHTKGLYYKMYEKQRSWYNEKEI